MPRRRRIAQRIHSVPPRSGLTVTPGTRHVFCSIIGILAVVSRRSCFAKRPDFPILSKDHVTREHSTMRFILGFFVALAVTSAAWANETNVRHSATRTPPPAGVHFWFPTSKHLEQPP